MKRAITILTFAMLVMVLVLSGCKKEGEVADNSWEEIKRKRRIRLRSRRQLPADGFPG